VKQGRRQSWTNHGQTMAEKLVVSDLDNPNLSEELASQERVKQRLLLRSPFQVVLFRHDFIRMGHLRRAETLRCPEIYILGERENYGTPRLAETDHSRRKARVEAKSNELGRFKELAGNGKMDVVFRKFYSDEWVEFWTYMTENGLNRVCKTRFRPALCCKSYLKRALFTLAKDVLRANPGLQIGA
jgi:hypothetical protein